MSSLKLGIDACFARKRWPEPEEWMRIVKEDLGLDYVEFCSDLLDPVFVSDPARSRIAREVKTAAQAYGITIFDYYTGFIPHCLNLLSHPDMDVRRDGLRWCEGAICVAAGIGARGLGGHFDTLADRDWRDPARRKFMIENLERSFKHLSRVAADEGLEFILWEQMYTPNEVPYTLAEADELYRWANDGAKVPIYLTVDVGHACCRNYPHRDEDNDPYLWLRRFANISLVIHLQQTGPEGSHHWPFTGEYNAKGIISAERVIDAIEESGSKENYLILEIFHPLGANEERVIEDLARSAEYWREHMNRRGG